MSLIVVVLLEFGSFVFKESGSTGDNKVDLSRSLTKRNIGTTQRLSVKSLESDMVITTLV